MTLIHGRGGGAGARHDFLKTARSRGTRQFLDIVSSNGPEIGHANSEGYRIGVRCESTRRRPEQDQCFFNGLPMMSALDVFRTFIAAPSVAAS
jgi:hypothetical protein